MMFLCLSTFADKGYEDEESKGRVLEYKGKKIDLNIPFTTSDLDIDKTPITAELSELWLKQKHSEFKNISAQLLKKNPNDILGLLMLYEYQRQVLDLDALPITINKLLTECEKIKTSNFSKRLPLLEASIDTLKETISIYLKGSKEELEKDRKKNMSRPRPLYTISMVEALEKDGLLKPYESFFKEIIQKYPLPDKKELMSRRNPK